MRPLFIAWLTFLAHGCVPNEPPVAPGPSFIEAGPALAPIEGGFAYAGEILGLNVSFTGGSTALAAGPESIALRTVAWGRDTNLRAFAPAAPEAADCDDALGEDCVARIVRDDGAATEWWEASPGRLEVGWDLAEEPAGHGPVVIDVAVAGAEAILGEEGEDLRLQSPTRSVTLHDTTAWDDAGRPLDVRLVPTERGFRVEVQADGARWPIHIDPTTLTAAWQVTGTGFFGARTAGLGDVNGDGFPDIAVAAYTASSYAGQVYVYHGSASGFGSSPDTTLTGAYRDLFGACLSAAGDLNGDGYDDMVVGAEGYDSTYPGTVYVFHGSASGISTTAATTYTGGAGDRMCWGSGAGDTNNDGYDDLVIGAYLYSSSTGRAWLYFGSATGASSTASVTFTAPAAGYGFGSRVTTLGDVNNDGYDDLAISGAVYATTGVVQVFLGAPAGPSTTASWTKYGTGTMTIYGVGLSGGDFNGDNYADLSIGAPWTGGSNGTVWVYHGSASGLSSTASTTLSGSGSMELGKSLASTDWDNDGYDDLIVGADGYSTTAGTMRVYLGSASGVSSSHTASVSGPALSHLGYHVAAAGDTNGDGAGDLLTGAFYYSGTTGMAAVYLGSADADADGYVSGSASTEDCDDTDATVHPGATELTGDGVDQNCDDAETCYDDDDDDGYLDSAGDTRASTDTDCADTSEGTSSDPTTDCDDTVASKYPGATEVVGDGIDQSCDSAETCYDDDDNDGYLDTTADTRASTDTDCTDAYEGTSTDLTTDCDDSSSAIKPGATEITGDSVDQNCDSAETCYDDDDNDGYLDSAADTRASTDTDCADAYEGTTSDLTTDCDDTVSTKYPGATETVGDSVDQDCDGYDACYDDDDNDGYLDTTGDTRASADTDCADAYEGTSTDPTTDCDDSNSAIKPGATEITGDSVDQNCDAVETCYEDDDDDGYLDTTADTRASADTDCTDTYEGTTSDLTTDCDDTDATVNPAATEVPGDGVDQTCDSKETCYDDDDNDGYLDTTGDTRASSDADCTDAFEGLATDPTTDCSDSSGSIHPGATEFVGDELDYDCDGTEVCYDDDDDDGYLDTSNDTRASTDTDCDDANEGSTGDLTTDCDDADSSINPAAAEGTGDGVDQNCDGRETCFDDDDDDGYLDTTADTRSSSDSDCSDTNEGLGTDSTSDCDDTSALVHPGAAEAVGDELDADCDGAELCYDDDDDDGYVDTALDTRVSSDTDCADANEASTSTPTSDCDDADASFHPGAAEGAGDGLDNDCDGTEVCYDDADDDGALDTSGRTRASADTDCADAFEGTNADITSDCDDGSAAAYVGAPEIPGNGVDESCDGVDDCYADLDGDRHGGLDVTVGTGLVCDGAGESKVAYDCDDSDAATYPGAEELPGDSVDQNCDGAEDCFVDADSDGDGVDSLVSSTTLACSDVGTSPTNTDCNDAAATVYAGAPEVPANGVDEDCDTFEQCYADTDGDTYGNEAALVASTALSCEGDDVAANTEDCDDDDAGVNPDGEELAADGVDQDCDGFELCFVDADLDLHGVPISVYSSSLACDVAGASPVSDDCDDADARAHPGADEVVADGVDEDCDGSETCYLDADLDGFGSALTVASAELVCTDPGTSESSTDCDDVVATTFPNAEEVCNSVDDNCDGSVDEGVSECDVDRDRSLCGCSTGAGAAWSMPLLALAVLSLRRRRAAGASFGG